MFHRFGVGQHGIERFPVLRCEGSRVESSGFQSWRHFSTYVVLHRFVSRRSKSITPSKRFARHHEPPALDQEVPSAGTSASVWRVARKVAEQEILRLRCALPTLIVVRSVAMNLSCIVREADPAASNWYPEGTMSASPAKRLLDTLQGSFGRGVYSGSCIGATRGNVPPIQLFG